MPTKQVCSFASETLVTGTTMAVDESHTNTDTFNYTTRTEVLGSDTRAPSPSQRQRSPSPRRWLKPHSEAQIPQTFAGKGGLPGAGLCRGKPAAPRLGQPVRPRWPLRERVKHRDRAPASKLHRRLSHRVSPSAAATPPPPARPSSPLGTRSAQPQPGQPEGSPGAAAWLPGPSSAPQVPLTWPPSRPRRGCAEARQRQAGKASGGSGERAPRSGCEEDAPHAQPHAAPHRPKWLRRSPPTPYSSEAAQCYGFSFSPTSAGLPAPSLHLPPRP